MEGKEYNVGEMIKHNGGALAATGFTKEQIDVIRNVVAKDANDSELAFFLSFCRSKGLDPFSKEVYFTKRNGKNGPQITIQTGIDGFRSQAESSGEYEGQDGPYWCGADGKWVDVWLDKKPPAAAKIGILRKGFRQPVWAVATWEQYYPKQDTWMWDKMGANQLAKCAEALAFRKAFPRKMSGMYADAEMDQAGPVNGKPTEVAIVQSPKVQAPANQATPETRTTATTSNAQIPTVQEKENTASPLVESSRSANGVAPSNDVAPSTATSESEPQPASMPDKIRTTDAELAELAEPEDGEDIDFVECWKLVKDGHKKAGTLVTEWVTNGHNQRRTNRQSAKLHVLRNMLELTDADWHAGIKRYYNKESSRDLSIEEATDMISKLETQYNKRKYKTPTVKAAYKEQTMVARSAEMAENLEAVTGVTAVDLVQKTFNGATVVK